jgi:hypothetical protein
MREALVVLGQKEDGGFLLTGNDVEGVRLINEFASALRAQQGLPPLAPNKWEFPLLDAKEEG